MDELEYEGGVFIFSYIRVSSEGKRTSHEIQVHANDYDTAVELAHAEMLRKDAQT